MFIISLAFRKYAFSIMILICEISLFIVITWNQKLKIWFQPNCKNYRISCLCLKGSTSNYCTHSFDNLKPKCTFESFARKSLLRTYLMPHIIGGNLNIKSCKNDRDFYHIKTRFNFAWKGTQHECLAKTEFDQLLHNLIQSLYRLSSQKIISALLIVTLSKTTFYSKIWYFYHLLLIEAQN